MDYNYGSQIKEQMIRDEEEAEMTDDQIEDAKEKMVDNEIKNIREKEFDLLKLPKPEQWQNVFTKHWFDKNIIGINW